MNDLLREMTAALRAMTAQQRESHAGLLQQQDQLITLRLLVQALIESHPDPTALQSAAQRLLQADVAAQAALARPRSASPPSGA